MRVVLTGPSGHLGSCLLPRLLAAGHTVRALCLGPTPSLDGLPIQRVQGDVRDPTSLQSAFAGMDLLIHMAAVISIDPRSHGLMYAVNVQGVANVAQAALATGIQRMVHVSSVHAYRTVRQDHALVETDAQCLGTADPAYDRTKAAGEALLRCSIHAGLDAVILNPAGIIGPDDHGPSHFGRVLRLMARGRMPVLPRGGFCWVDVRDVADAIIAAMDRGQTGRNYLLSSQSVSMATLSTWAQQQLGRRRPVVLEIPLRLARLGLPLSWLGSQLTGSARGLTADSLAALDAQLQIDTTRARQVLGFDPRPVELSVKDAIDWAQRMGVLRGSRRPALPVLPQLPASRPGLHAGLRAS